uniref:Predicted nucleic acid-binding protein, contains PIN domain n=1 Tax=Candidatus Kentrum sp. SD TaxID=2126332 RepID=A0A450YLM5_9GAMM|nr:MAG: Predicted nucleic acid-binding protein, contains PIN domain [Candidatus Kentron sp. SD]VFK48242.1 MAG: Predicted nucleic acid-binding protein, contains PIN domain [Candidatus Kentron sp. SD]VFK80607.1 MAG: Predicted nucleic acid-binding protein, contains PIN domain [Candidatus Kentron sp. SD]
MYLFDTNIFLEILLSQEKSADCKKALNKYIGHIYISDFSLHSIGVILFRHGKGKIFNNFSADVLSKIDIVTLSKESYGKLSEFEDKCHLDFDDAYQCGIAEEWDLAIITMDKDFKRVSERIRIEFL